MINWGCHGRVVQAKNPHRVGMLCSPLEPRLAKTRLNRVEQNKGSLRLPFPHRPEVFIARVWRRKKLEVRIIRDRTGTYKQVCLRQLLQQVIKCLFQGTA